MQTQKQLRLKRYNDIIAKNKKLFAAGSTLTRDKFVSLFAVPDVVTAGNYVDVQRSNLRLVTAQTEINMLMRENGLYIRSKDYYSSFHVVEKKQTKNVIARYSSEVDVNRHCVSRLEMSFANKVKSNNWGQYDQLTEQQILNLDTAFVSRRHESVIKRLQSY
ncbi:hypothetical protein AD45P2_00250 [Alteromonas phage vB_AmaP_AD45-P2]|uniref:hypothetical protein n=1 Tax=Pseudorhizobium pelagicum TaxID=1509405 RepID=UPI000342792F|nr:hypothetical protein [Pseudorhizobium pelagicum]AGM47221.1 hypothetical protein AD45P2_00250 [Alteromonas phage vB_AmaP_AD45-P2]